MHFWNLLTERRAMQKENREKILHKFIENPHQSKRNIAKELGIAPSTVGRVISRWLATGTTDRKPGSGGDRKSNKHLATKIDRSLQRNPKLSVRDLASQFGTTSSTVQRIKKKMKYKSHKIQKKPKRNERQAVTAKTRARKLYSNLLAGYDGCVMMDDETYIKADSKQIPGQQYYSKRVDRNVNDRFKYKYVEKYPKKYLIWQALCSCGLQTAPYVTSGTLTSETYIKECLQKRLLPLYRQHDTTPIFWPDLAAIHYSRVTISWFEANKINYVVKDLNPPNCPTLRGIEKYWAALKREVGKRPGSNEHIDSFKRRVHAASNMFDKSTVQNFLRHTKANLRKLCRGEEI